VRRTVAALVAVLSLAGLLTACSTDAGTRTRGSSDRLPDVSLPSLTGGAAVDLGSFRGPAVVNLWAQWCVPCKRELPIYQKFFGRHGSQVRVLGVDWQDTQGDKARALAKRSGVTYPLVVDDEPAFRVNFLPRLVLVDADGKITFQQYVEIKSLDQLEGLVEKHLGVSL
jgi:thiol-disulfide isomerase/thioredoxin